MKNTSLLCAALLCSSALFSPLANAAPTTSGETYTYSAKKFQQVCRGKSVGTPASMALNGVIFNGTCQVMLSPTSRSAWDRITDSTLAQACEGKNNETISTTLNDQAVNGKCVLSFHTIEPTGATYN